MSKEEFDEMLWETWDHRSFKSDFYSDHNHSGTALDYLFMLLSRIMGEGGF